MRYLLDTCTLSEFLKKTSNKNVLKWFRDHAEETQYISVLTIGEIQKGISRLERSKQKAELQVWFESVLARYDGRILPINLETANIWGKLKADIENRGVPLPLIDSLLAATALEHDLTVVTRNEADFSPANVKVLNIWK